MKFIKGRENYECILNDTNQCGYIYKGGSKNLVLFTKEVLPDENIGRNVYESKQSTRGSSRELFLYRNNITGIYALSNKNTTSVIEDILNSGVTLFLPLIFIKQAHLRDLRILRNSLPFCE